MEIQVPWKESVHTNAAFLIRVKNSADSIPVNIFGPIEHPFETRG